MPLAAEREGLGVDGTGNGEDAVEVIDFVL
jgi:hypothetical protein